MGGLHRSAVARRQLICQAKLPIFQSIYVTSRTYGHEPWVATKRMRLWNRSVRNPGGLDSDIGREACSHWTESTATGRACDWDELPVSEQWSEFTQVELDRFTRMSQWNAQTVGRRNWWTERDYFYFANCSLTQPLHSHNGVMWKKVNYLAKYCYFSLNVLSFKCSGRFSVIPCLAPITADWLFPCIALRGCVQYRAFVFFYNNTFSIWQGLSRGMHILLYGIQEEQTLRCQWIRWKFNIKGDAALESDFLNRLCPLSWHTHTRSVHFVVW